jgi:hypothetical protein
MLPVSSFASQSLNHDASILKEKVVKQFLATAVGPYSSPPRLGTAPNTIEVWYTSIEKKARMESMIM